MTFGHYIRTIKKVGKIRGDQIDMVSGLFIAGGYVVAKIPRNTIDSWIKGKGAPDGRMYFPNGVDGAGFIENISRLIQLTWKDIHIALCAEDDIGIYKSDPNDCYEFCQDLLSHFRELLGLPKAISLHHVHVADPKGISRKKELEEIEGLFRSYKYVILVGIPGIGKSHMALEYASRLQDSDDWVIQRVICDDAEPVQEAVSRLRFDGLTGDGKGRNLEIILSALKNQQKRALIIFDNLNQRVGQDKRDEFKNMLECNRSIRFLITSRDAKILGDDRRYVINISPFDIDTLLSFYAYHRFEEPNKHIGFINERRNLLTKLFTQVGHHTLMIELLAKLARDSSMDESEINEKLKEGLDLSPESVYAVKDNIALEGRVQEIIKKVFAISSLDELEKNILTHLALIPTSGMDIKMFKDLADYKRDFEIFRLRDRGWVIIEEEYHRVSLHPLISETIFNDDTVETSKETYTSFIANISTRLEATVRYSREWHDLNKTMARYTMRVLFFSFQPLLPHLKGKYSNALRVLNEHAREYTEMDLPELVQMQLLSEIINLEKGDESAKPDSIK